MDEEQKLKQPAIPKKSKKMRKGSDNNVQKKFELLMNTGGDLDLEMRLMNSKLRKINKEFSKKKHQIKSILKSSKPTKKVRKDK
jgi:hypothetical protein